MLLNILNSTCIILLFTLFSIRRIKRKQEKAVVENVEWPLSYHLLSLEEIIPDSLTLSSIERYCYGLMSYSKASQFFRQDVTFLLAGSSGERCELPLS